MASYDASYSIGDLTRVIAVQPRWEKKMADSPEFPDHSDSSTAETRKPNTEAIDRSTSTVQTIWNIGNAVQGVSVLSLPYAVSRGGWVALGAFLVVGLMSNITGKLLIDCLYDKPLKPVFPFLLKRRRRHTAGDGLPASIQRTAGHYGSTSVANSETLPLMKQYADTSDDVPAVMVRKTYAEIGKACWPFGGYVLVLLVQCVELLGVCSLSLVLMGQAIAMLTNPWVDLSVDAWTAVIALAVLPTVFLPRLAQLGWLSLVGILSMLGVTITVLANSVSRYSNWHRVNFDTPSWNHFPVAIGIIVFGYAAHGQFPSFHIRMKEPGRFGFAINVAFTLVTFIDIILALLGFLAYGSASKDIISQNMSGTWSITIDVLLLVNLLLSYALPMFPVSALLDGFLTKYFPLCGNGSGLRFFYHATTRMFLVGVTLLVAVSVPNFHVLMSFIGSITCVILVFVLPATFHIVLFHRRLSTVGIAIDAVLVLVSTAAGIAGIYASYVELAAS